MIQKVVFTTYADLIHFLAENELDQFAVLRQSDTEIELAYMVEMEDQPLLG